MEKRIREWIEDAELVLVGVGKEFEEETFQAKEEALQAINQLESILEKKNYFAISVCTNDILKSSRLQSDRTVQPCGTVAQKQCVNRCEEGLMRLSEVEEASIRKMLTSTDAVKIHERELGVCPKCGSPLVLNTVYIDTYDENGYLKDWSRYTKWLLNAPSGISYYTSTSGFTPTL